MKSKGVVVLAVSYRESDELLRNFQEEIPVSFPVLSDVEGKTGRDYLIRGHPVTYLIERRGFFTGRVIGERDWSSLMAKNLVESLLSH